ncbi:spermidine/putrescine ABC transporter ATP-binding protein [Escherichia coli]|uniref:Spermidine/putrescine ABC transporter ATP-binding protein n=1 Tax=Escherichia coli TaxID=562 RepID=A0A376MWQ5_ECOLX|nr:spermidine/putrescine ABC transporter ATP-binding protein [Escherichia coli]
MPRSSNVSTSSAYAPTLKAASVISTLTSALNRGKNWHVLLRPEDLRVEEINDDNHAEGLIGYVRERNYKGMTLESVVELENGKMVMVSEFFNEDDPDFDHSLDQKMAINWVESWEVVLADEEHK